MTRNGTIAVAALVAVVLAGGALVAFRSDRPGAPPRAEPSRASEGTPNAGDSQRKPAEPTLYCEFTNFADRTPVVGFYFLIEEAKSPPSYALIFQREKDGSQTDLPESAPRPEWRFDGAENPVVIHAPDDSIQINVYDYDPKKPGVNWFEAGLRSVRYRNLGGKCRRSAA